MEYDYAG
ncbi:Protein of unknown function [Bacillus toyonensis]|nr:Protein of unknown function [Bacillus toyonensis]